jgi:hypothetical protein
MEGRRRPMPPATTGDQVASWRLDLGAPDTLETRLFAILRPYSPLERLSDKSWQVGEVERAKA